MFDALAYLQDFTIPYVTQGKNTSSGWIGIRCPLCNDRSEHGGFRLSDGMYRCWRCGRHDIVDVIMALEGCEYHIACRRLIDYRMDGPPAELGKVRIRRGQELKWPPGLVGMKKIHYDYLLSRGFDPWSVTHKYGLRFTGPVGDYRYRIIVPIIADGETISYQGRDVTGLHKLRYKACRPQDEAQDHRTVLYGMDNAEEDSVVVVEGIFDAWRIGDGAVATFGTSLADAGPQVALMAERWKRLFILFDPEPPAQEKARKLVAVLRVLGLEAYNVRLEFDGDPAELGNDRVEELRREIFG